MILLLLQGLISFLSNVGVLEKDLLVMFGDTFLQATFWVMGLVMPILFLIFGGLTFADRFVEGRAVGTLGIIIAGFGVLGEAYQFTALMLV